MGRRGWTLYLFLMPFSLVGQSLTVVVNGRIVPASEWLTDALTTLPARETSLQIDLLLPKVATAYSYRLWQTAATKWFVIHGNTTVLYHNLSGDEYHFEIRRNSESPLFKQRYFVENALWQRWWFGPSLFLYGLFIISVLMYLFYRYRIRQFLHLQQTRDRIARDLHDDMGSYLSSISILSSSAANATAKDPERARQSIDKIGQTARHVMGAMSDIVWSINPEHDSLDKVVARMQDVANELFTDSSTTVSLKADPGVLSLQLPLDKRHDFFLIYKEALNNVARYSEATQIRIRLHRVGAALVLVVQDNGKGFDTAQPKARNGGGNGLKNMYVRAGKIGGTLTIESELEQGTTVTLRI